MKPLTVSAIAFVIIYCSQIIYKIKNNKKQKKSSVNYFNKKILGTSVVIAGIVWLTASYLSKNDVENITQSSKSLIDEASSKVTQYEIKDNVGQYGKLPDDDVFTNLVSF